jgi:hypothetical protein
VLCVRAAYFVPLAGFSRAAARSGVANVVDLLIPMDLGDLTGARQGGRAPYACSCKLAAAGAEPAAVLQWRPRG